MIPCKENKCILLPVCKNKIMIKCELLFKHILTHYKDTYRSTGLKTSAVAAISLSNTDLWIHINKDLPKLKNILPE